MLFFLPPVFRATDLPRGAKRGNFEAPFLRAAQGCFSRAPPLASKMLKFSHGDHIIAGRSPCRGSVAIDGWGATNGLVAGERKMGSLPEPIFRSLATDG